jgi:cyclopropane fatty-acyl-phospholipid synthase-like methyltransferase
MRQHAPAAERNKDPILAQLRTVLGERARVLEIGSGTGIHAVHFARALPGVTWLPSDPDAAACESIAAWIEHAGCDNVQPPLPLDVRDMPWPVDVVDAVFSANMIHISPPTTWPALLRGAHACLRPGGALVIYGPFFVRGEAAESNRAFDASLRARDPSWGVRELDDVAGQARELGFAVGEPVAMPANNLLVVLTKTR